MQRTTVTILASFGLVLGLAVVGCEFPLLDEVRDAGPNQLPNTTLDSENGPAAGDTVFQRSTDFVVNGSDLDGEVMEFRWRIVDADTVWDWRVVPVTSNRINVANLQNGEHVFQVQSVDNRGGRDPSPAQRRFVTLEDLEDPTVTITSGPSGRNAPKSGRFEWTGGDNLTVLSRLVFRFVLEGANVGVVLERQVVGVTFANYINLPNDTYTFRLTATDLAGNRSEEVQRGFTVNQAGR